MDSSFSRGLEAQNSDALMKGKGQRGFDDILVRSLTVAREGEAAGVRVPAPAGCEKGTARGRSHTSPHVMPGPMERPCPVCRKPFAPSYSGRGHRLKTTLLCVPPGNGLGASFPLLKGRRSL